jgi:D-alanine transaminase
LNGHFGPLADAKISVLDRGFIFGDAVYEVIPSYMGKLFQFEAHMDRLERSLSEVFIDLPFGRDRWKAIFERLLGDNASLHQTPPHLFNASIYLQISRGVAPRDHVIPQFIEPTIFVMCQPATAANPKARETGVFCITHEDFRWKKAHIKTTSLMGSILAKRLSVNQNAAETVMFRDGQLSEASSSNVWVVKNGTVIGTPKGPLVLEGIRYTVLSQLCDAQNIPFVLKAQTKAEVFEADELLLTSASKEILPITQLDDRPIANGRPGPIYHQLYAAYQALKQHE